MKGMHSPHIRAGPMSLHDSCVYTDGRVDYAYELVSFISVGVGGLISLPPVHIDALMIVLYIMERGWLFGWECVDTRYCGYI